MDEVQVDSDDLVLLNDYIDLLLDPTLPTEQFYINNCIPTSLTKTSNIQKLSEITTNKTKPQILKKEQFDQNFPEISKKTELFILKKEQLDQNCDVLSAAISESQIDREDFSTFENFRPKESGIITNTSEITTSPIFQLIPGRDFSENFTLSDIVNTSSNPRGNRTNYQPHKEYLNENENPIATLGLIENENLKFNATLKEKGTKPDCKLCTKTFARMQVLKIHMASVHEGKKPFKCEICDQKFAGKSSMKRHNEVVHEGKKRFQCSTCKVRFSKKENMERHVAAIHDNNRFSFFVLNFGSCPI